LPGIGKGLKNKCSAKIDSLCLDKKIYPLCPEKSTAFFNYYKTYHSEKQNA
jgi:hypothetical protein